MMRIFGNWLDFFGNYGLLSLQAGIFVLRKGLLIIHSVKPF